MKNIRIGTRESELAVWQASLVQKLLKERNIDSSLVYIKSEGDTNTNTPLYELGIQGIFTRALDIALINDQIDVAVHSLKDVPTKPANGIRQAAILKRHSYKDILVFKGSLVAVEARLWKTENDGRPFTIATGSLRRQAQWLHRYPHHRVENLRGNMNTRLEKLKEQPWDGAVFAAAGLERIRLRPTTSIELDWMLPSAAQGAICAVCRENDDESFQALQPLNDEATEICTQIERDFLRALSGGCSTPIAALAVIENDRILFRGNILSVDGKQKYEIEKNASLSQSGVGEEAALELLQEPKVVEIIDTMRNARQ